MNRAGLAMIEAESLDEVKGLCVYPMISGEYRSAFEAMTQEVFAGEPRTLEFRMIGLKGRPLWLYTHAVPMRDEHGAIVSVLAITTDITERKQAEAELAGQKTMLQQIFDSSNVGIGLVDRQGCFTLANRRMAEMFGCSMEEFIGSDYIDHVHPVDREKARLNLAALVGGQMPAAEVERLYMRKDGSSFYGHLTAKRFFDPQGQEVGMVGLITDITRRKQAEDAVRQSEAKFRSVFDQAIDGIMIAEVESKRLIEANTAICAMLGYAHDELMRLGAADIHPKEQFPAVVEAFEKQVRGERSLAREIPLLRKDGSVFYADVNATPITIDGKHCLVGIFRDITERKRSEEERERLAKAVSIASEGIAVTDDQDRFVYVNDAHARIYGYAPEELIGQSWRNITASYLVPLVEQELAQTLHRREIGIWSGGFVAVRKDGTSVFTEVSANARWNSQGGYLGHICVVRDITERKQAEEKLRQSEQFVRTILDTVDEGFIVVDRDYRIVTANKAYCGQSGMTCDEVIGRHCFEISHRASQPCYEQGEDCAVCRVFESGEPQTATHVHQGPDGQVLHVETKAFPIRDKTGRIISAIETVSNITEKHLLAEERLKTQKLESIGTLAGGIAHDFNNLLQGVFGFISLAKLSLDRKERAAAMLEQAEKALHQSVNLTTQLLTFSKGGKPVTKVLSLGPVIENAVKFALSGSRVDHKLIIDNGLRPVEADEGQLGQVIQNIVLNADQAMPRGGIVTITARNLAAGGDLPHGLARDCVAIEVRDTGVGIPTQDLDRIFDPYFTTKEGGSGLGLATSYSIIRNHGGEITVRSEPGKGSVFTILLPASALEPEDQAGRDAPNGSRRGRVLVMDDEDIVRTVAGELLRELGHDAEFAAHGEAAIERYQEAKNGGRPYDLVILDLTIRGGMGGLETLGRLRKIDPNVKAVVSSGYSDDEVVSDYRKHGFTAFLKKPYDLFALREMLDANLS